MLILMQYVLKNGNLSKLNYDKYDDMVKLRYFMNHVLMFRLLPVVSELQSYNST